MTSYGQISSYNATFWNEMSYKKVIKGYTGLSKLLIYKVN